MHVEGKNVCWERIGLNLVLFLPFSIITFFSCKHYFRAGFLLSTQTVERKFSMLQTLKLNLYFSSLLFHPVPLTEAASRAIVQFLEINQSEEASRGWMLLTTINLLASSGQVSLKQQRLMKVGGLETHKNHNNKLWEHIEWCSGLLSAFCVKVFFLLRCHRISASAPGGFNCLKIVLLELEVRIIAGNCYCSPKASWTCCCLASIEIHFTCTA